MLDLVDDILLTGDFSELSLSDCLLDLLGMKLRNGRGIDWSDKMMMMVMLFFWSKLEEFHNLYIHKVNPC